ncbi:MAG: glycosyltransferase [Vicinamibacterales bacterium]
MAPSRSSGHAPEPDVLRVLVLLEARTLTGPAKNILAVFRTAPRLARAQPIVPRLAVFHHQGHPPLAPSLLDAAASAGVPVEEIPECGRFDAGTIDRLRDACEAFRPHIVQSHSVKSHALVRVSGISRSAAWLAFHHGYTTTDVKVRVYNTVDVWSLRGASAIVTTCRAFADGLTRRGLDPSKIQVLHNAVTEDDLAARSDRRDRRELTVLSVGRLSREKGHDVLLRAFALMARNDSPPCKLILAGEGPEREWLARLANRLGMDRVVTFRGAVSNPAALYECADLFALPSHSEGSPNALLEAMAAGMPVVASDVGGVAEIVAHGRTGLLVRRGDTQALAASLQRLAADPDLRRQLGAAARAHVRRCHAVEARTRAVLDIYSRLAPPRLMHAREEVA